jgi:hypothetical protein
MKLNQIVSISLISVFFGCADPAPYHREKGMWFFHELALDTRPVGVLEPLNNSFAKDSRQAFYRNTAIEGSDGTSFVVLNEHYARDKARVYYCDTYRRAGAYLMVRYGSIRVIAEADAGSFIFLQTGYAKDFSHVFYDGTCFDVSDAPTFELLDGEFSKDRRQVYYRLKAIDGADPSSFVPLDSHYSKDQNHAYFSGLSYDSDRQVIPSTKVIRHADLPSFHALEGGYAADKNAMFFDGEIIGASPVSDLSRTLGGVFESYRSDKIRPAE